MVISVVRALLANGEWFASGYYPRDEHESSIVEQWRHNWTPNIDQSRLETSCYLFPVSWAFEPLFARILLIYLLLRFLRSYLHSMLCERLDKSSFAPFSLVYSFRFLKNFWNSYFYRVQKRDGIFIQYNYYKCGLKKNKICSAISTHTKDKIKWKASYCRRNRSLLNFPNLKNP